MTRMPGEGPQPSVEEYLTRVAPPAYQQPWQPYTGPKAPQTLNQALQAAGKTVPATLATNGATVQQGWALIDDFLARQPRPRYFVTQRAETVQRPFLGRARTVVSTGDIGSGWWV